jgi:hypothetical protein
MTQANNVGQLTPQVNSSGVLQVAGGGTGLSAVGTSGYVLASNGATNVYSNITGYSGYSGYSGINGASGTSGYSGTNGTNGASGTSGYSGATGSNGSAGTSGYSGYSGSSATGVSSLNGNTGALKGYDFISTQTLTTTTNVQVTGIPSGYSNILVYCNFRVDTAGSDSVYPIRFSINNGSSYISTSNYYQQFQYNDNNTGVSYIALSDSGFAFAGIGGNGRGWIGGQTNYVQAWFIINQPTTTSYPGCTWNMGTFAGTGSDSGWYAGQGFLNSTNTYINAFQIVRQSGNKSITGGYINIYGTKNA